MHQKLQIITEASSSVANFNGQKSILGGKKTNNSQNTIPCKNK